jgi:hypothetical protein
MDHSVEGEGKQKVIVRVDTVLILDPETGEEQTRVVETRDTILVNENTQ